MRLYLLELTPLEYLSDLSTPPTNGDIVAYMRAGQDPSGVHNSLTHANFRAHLIRLSES